MEPQAPNSPALAPPSPSPMAAPWADLVTDMVYEIALRVPCALDRARMAAVCHAWCAVVAEVPHPAHGLPSLFLAPADATGVYCYLSGRLDHNRFPGPRHFGAYDGGWLFLAYGQTRGHRLLNVRTGESFTVPDVLEDEDEDDYRAHSMVVLAVTLSFPPDNLECVAAGIVTYRQDFDVPRRRHFAFWRPGDGRAFCDVAPDAPVGPGLELEDVVYHRDSFVFLTRGEHIIECTPILDTDGSVLAMMCELFRFRGRGHGYGGQLVRARYLVASRGELLMVVRLAPHPHAPTSSFKVFRRIQRDDSKDKADEYPWCWSELDALGGRMLFVGRGCSRSYEAGQYPGIKDGVYFLDDGSFDDDEMMFRCIGERQYPCSDIGRWSEGPPPHVDRYFPERVPSHNSPPAWFLP